MAETADPSLVSGLIASPAAPARPAVMIRLSLHSPICCSSRSLLRSQPLHNPSQAFQVFQDFQASQALQAFQAFQEFDPPPLMCMPKHRSSPSRTHPTSPVSTQAPPSPTCPTKRRRLSSTHISTLAMPSIIPTISLTSSEFTLRRLLLDCAAYIDQNHLHTGPHPPSAASTPLTLRFTGGWVRDKLLQGQSSDIDVAIDTMTGYNFAVHLSTYISLHGPKYNITTPPHSIHKINSNPLKSKHLETATTKILDLDIDLVNLRSEAYSEDSRIPVSMEFGTPTEDALRRDATVNALFYNLHTEEVEDFTGRGLAHLQQGLIDTPLPPFETFRDDPLRVLRLVRFASRFNFSILPPVQAAMRDPEIRKHLATKISRERVGTEVEKMLNGQDPHHSLSLIHNFNLTSVIFCPPIDEPPELPWGDVLPAINALKYIFSTNPPSHLVEGFTPGDRYLAWIIAATIPWRHKYEGDGRKRISSAAVAAREGLRLRNKDFDVMGSTYKNLEDMKSTVTLVSTDPNGGSRLTLGTALRRWRATWRNQLLHAALIELVDVWEEVDGEPTEPAKDVISRYDLFVRRVVEENLSRAWAMKSLVDGVELADMLGKEVGIWMKEALEKVIAWQIEHPEGEREEAEEWIRERKEAGEI
ncbi:hypothetical protein EV426DRAFT_609923 [Tirmania nivea]|nr:hypothetical protein EV426DRAFT_609923 [Tirmania nivea]